MNHTRPTPVRFIIILKNGHFVEACQGGVIRKIADVDGVIFEGTDPFVSVDDLLRAARMLREAAREHRRSNRSERGGK